MQQPRPTDMMKAAKVIAAFTTTVIVLAVDANYDISSVRWTPKAKVISVMNIEVGVMRYTEDSYVFLHCRKTAFECRRFNEITTLRVAKLVTAWPYSRLHNIQGGTGKVGQHVSVV